MTLTEHDCQIRIFCRTCGALPGNFCRTASGKKAYEYHAVRNYMTGVSQYAYTRHTKTLANADPGA